MTVFRPIALFLISLAALGQSRSEAEYYLAAYARHYGVPVAFARAVVQQESAWRSCARSTKGALGLMQLMPQTAARFGVTDPCDIKQNISGGIRYLTILLHKFHGDLRLVAAAYYAGEGIVERHGLAYSNPEVVLYVKSLRRLTLKTGERNRRLIGKERQCD